MNGRYPFYCFHAFLGIEYLVLYSPSMDEASTKEELRPVKKQLVCFLNSLLLITSDRWHQKQLKLSGEDMPRDEKVAILKDSLAAIGRRIEHVLNSKEAGGEDRDRWRRHLWTYAGFLKYILCSHHFPLLDL